MKKLLLLSFLVLFGCSEKEEEIVEEIPFPDLKVQIKTSQSFPLGEFQFKEVCCGSSSSAHCQNDALLLGCYKRNGDAYLVDNFNGDLVSEVITDCNSTIKIKVNPGIGWRMGNISTVGDFYGEIEQNLDSEIILNSSTTNCRTSETIVIDVSFYLDINLTP